ncbi:hypothetical protein PBI_GAIA_150 [Mycobacterium phage Gaia]|uniref:Uncharacterized protein n=1 Tax=Mycobacterium phage Gaia TaxID=1486472 RepID=A0A068F4R4_9CAUD|nr:hypothetical protein VC46_gp086 [Mycobacterium phage Gaia]AID58966.1 hypothetical protein PBI_GAIA_150 [Mycobacterium phage Gaia]AYR00078.1 hypothetical protein PBI_NEBKISS_145 [Mycobacterium phage Nebkiss]
MGQQLIQEVEYGRLDNGQFIRYSFDTYTVSTANRKRITDREQGRSHATGDGWLEFPAHPATPELSEYVTRIRWF